ncbi:MAG: manganese efflux pump MntP family protein [Ignavibacteriaceae bacterium]|nr:manganese efflux pump MntP family protein [Ignavibacteriaceae bacterium]
MLISEIIVLAFGLALDAFAVSLGAGAVGRIGNHRGAVRLAFHFGLFQFLMPVIGWYVGFRIEPFVKSIDDWLAFLLLLYIGAKMIWDSFKPKDEFRKDPSKGREMVLLSVATSIDALVVGFSLAILMISVWYPAVIIGIVTALLSIIGIYLGKVIGSRFGKKMEVVGGMVIIGIGLKILISHFF